MTTVEFKTNIKDKVYYACHWLRNAIGQSPDTHFVVVTEDARQLSILDKALWMFSELDFLPHALLGSPLAARSRIVLTDNPDAEMPVSQVLVNLSKAVPGQFARFERLIELVAADESEKEAGRTRYVHYRDRGYTLLHEKVS